MNQKEWIIATCIVYVGVGLGMLGVIAFAGWLMGKP